MVYDGSVLKSPCEHYKAYAPVTASGITSTREGALVGTTRSPNLFTKKRRNGFRVNTDSVGEHLFLFDAPVDMNKPLSVTVTFRVRQRTDAKYGNVTAYIGKDEDGKEINTIVYGKYYTSSPSTNSILTLNGDFVDGEGKPIKLEFEEGSGPLDYNSLGWPIIVKNPHELLVMYNPTSPRYNYDNVVVEYTADGEGYEDYLGEDAAAFLVNADNGNSALMLCDGGRMFYTQEMGKNLYLPVENCIKLGELSEKITSAVPMLDNYIAVYKKNSFYRIKLNASGVGSYQVVATSDKEGSLSSFCACSLEEDNLCFNENGIFGTTEPSNADEHTSILFARDGFINDRLCKYSQAEKENAHFICHKGRAYLFIGGDVFVADKDYKSKGGLKDFLYEWWMLDNCPVSCAVSVFNEIYMGREDGYISVFKDGYSDITYINLDKNMYHYLLREREDYTEVIFDFGLGVGDGDTVYLGEHYLLYSKCTYDSEGKKVVLSNGNHFDFEKGCAKLYDGMDIMLCYENKEIAAKGVMSGLDLVKGEFNSPLTPRETELYLYIGKKKGSSYKLIDLEDHFALSYNGEYASLYSLDIDGIQLRHEQAVECAYYTSPLSFDESGESKALFSITVFPTKDTASSLKVGYETFDSSDLKEIRIGKYSAFDELSLGAFDFGRMYKGVKVGFFERGFDYIVIKVISSEGRSFGVSRIDVSYSKERRNI